MGAVIEAALASPTAGEPFSYDAELFDRRILNCCQRHAAVWLERAGAPVRHLFHRALLSSDAVLEQIIVGKQPKYAIQSGFFSEESLASIGIVQRTIAADRFDDIREDLLRAIDAHGFVLLSGNVFYFSHCVEFRNAHAQHVVVLHGRTADGVWEIVDDNPASVLCRYRHDDKAVSDFYENNTYRVFLDYDTSGMVSDAEAARRAQAELPTLVSAHEDTRWFYDHIGEIVANRLDAPLLKFRTLHDAFALLSGSRYCFAAYLELDGWPAPIVETARAFAQSAYQLKNLMAKAQYGGRINPSIVQERCSVLKAMDERLLGEVRDALNVS